MTAAWKELISRRTSLYLNFLLRKNWKIWVSNFILESAKCLDSLHKIIYNKAFATWPPGLSSYTHTYTPINMGDCAETNRTDDEVASVSDKLPHRCFIEREQRQQQQQIAAKKANIAFTQPSAYLTLLTSMRICQLQQTCVCVCVCCSSNCATSYVKCAA